MGWGLRWWEEGVWRDLKCRFKGGGEWGWGQGGHGAPALSCPLRHPQKMVESQRQNVLVEFERLRRLLVEEEQRLLQRLEEEELEVLPPLRESAARLEQQSTQLAQLIEELEGRCQLPALGLLQVSRPSPWWYAGGCRQAGSWRKPQEGRGRAGRPPAMLS